MIAGINVIWLLIPFYIGIPLVWLIRVVRGFTKHQDAVQTSWSDLDVALLRKHDLILKLVEAARPFVESDRNLNSDVAHLREVAVASRWNVQDHARDEGRLDAAVEALLGKVKESPDPDADRFLRDLRRELVAAAQHISVAAGGYNVAVQRFNTMQKTFPYSFIGKRLHLRPKPLYDAAEVAGTRSRVSPPRR